ncbi:hypothetical protein CPB86DRAFT_830047 [Serendipita vermifera]|nr:hypothetical protein CPB86DRAFT_830047 [Serendipita vermifera]
MSAPVSPDVDKKVIEHESEHTCPAKATCSECAARKTPEDASRRHNLPSMEKKNGDDDSCNAGTVTTETLQASVASNLATSQTGAQEASSGAKIQSDGLLVKSLNARIEFLEKQLVHQNQTPPASTNENGPPTPPPRYSPYPRLYQGYVRLNMPPGNPEYFVGPNGYPPQVPRFGTLSPLSQLSADGPINHNHPTLPPAQARLPRYHHTALSMISGHTRQRSPSSPNGHRPNFRNQRGLPKSRSVKTLPAQLRYRDPQEREDLLNHWRQHREARPTGIDFDGNVPNPDHVDVWFRLRLIFDEDFLKRKYDLLLLICSPVHWKGPSQSRELQDHPLPRSVSPTVENILKHLKDKCLWTPNYAIDIALPHILLTVGRKTRLRDPITLRSKEAGSSTGMGSSNNA